MMRIKIDEDLSELLKSSFLKHNHQAASVRDQGWAGLDDETLFSRVQIENEFFVTGDYGFADIRKFKPGTHRGIVIVNCRDQLISTFIRLIDGMLDQIKLEDHVGSLIVVSEKNIRIRKAK